MGERGDKSHGSKTGVCYPSAQGPVMQKAVNEIETGTQEPSPVHTGGGGAWQRKGKGLQVLGKTCINMWGGKEMGERTQLKYTWKWAENPTHCLGSGRLGDKKEKWGGYEK